MSTDADTAATVAADLARRLADVAPDSVATDGTGDAALMYRVRDDEHLRFIDHEDVQPAPRRTRGSVQLDQPSSFAEYVTAVHTDAAATRMYASLQHRSIVAVFNDHATADEPGWRDHTAQLVVQHDADWSAWMDRDGVLGSQRELGEFIEERLHSIVQPDQPGGEKFPTAGELLQVALTLTAQQRVEFESAQRLDNGDVSFKFRETTESRAGQASQLAIPERFAVSVSPFVGHPPVTLLARLRYRASRDGLRIGFKLMRPDLAEREAFEGITRDVATATPDDVPLLWGRSPEPIRAMPSN